VGEVASHAANIRLGEILKEPEVHFRQQEFEGLTV
jgi:hypothetical protein